MTRIYKKSFLMLFLLLAAGLLCSCPGKDFAPDYFGLNKEKEKPAEPSQGAETPEPAVAAISVFKIITGADGRQTEVPIPSGNLIEVGTGTFIAKDETNIGPKFTTTEKFKILNSSDTTADISIPSQLGPFSISNPMGQLKQKLAHNQFITIDITFSPSIDKVSTGGKVTQDMDIGGNKFVVSGIALDPSGRAWVNIIKDSGDIEKADVGLLTFNEVSLSAHPLRQFFTCSKITCEGTPRPAGCTPCTDATGGKCDLLTVNKGGEPVDAVGQDCKPAANDLNPASEINLSSSDLPTDTVTKKIIEVINAGTESLIIDSVTISELDTSRSKGEFSLNPAAIFKAESFSEIKGKITSAFAAGNNPDAESFPSVLPPYDPPVLTTRLFIVLAYHPHDILGSDGVPAAVGSSAKDEAILNITAGGKTREIHIAGTTTIKEVPALQVYVKSSTGLKPIANGEVLPFKGITATTTDLALPLFMKLSDSTTTALRISSIGMTGDNFEWLDTKEKIQAKPEGSRCSIPVLDDKGSQVDIITDLNPVGLNPNGFTLAPGSYTTADMPLFGCINFRRDVAVTPKTNIFKANMTVTAQEITTNGQPAINPDGSIKESSFSFSVLGVIDPIKGEIVLRITQTMAAIMNPQFPSISAQSSGDEWDLLIEEGAAKETDKTVFLFSIILDPFDEEYIYNVDGTVVSKPGDGITAVFRPIDTRAIPVAYDDPLLGNYASLVHDSTLPEGQQGIFTGYPNVPDKFRTSALKIFTISLSYPGPLAPPEAKPKSISQCEVIDPCTTEGQRKLGEGPSNPSYKGVCAFFYSSGGAYESPAFHYPTEEPPGTRRDMCADREKPYDLKPITGKYYLDGKMEFENSGLLFQGPTYFHNPSGPLGPVKPLNEIFHLTFTTETLLPISETKNVDRLPDKRIDMAKEEYRINLNDPGSNLPKLCDNSKKNAYIHGEYYSSWRYIAPLLKKDKEGTVATGCPEEDNNFTGGIAYLTGKRLDHDTGHATFVSAAKFSSSNDLTFAFKDVMFFMILNGWFCDPLGPEENMEGKNCYDKAFNARDASTQYSIVKKNK